MSLDTADQALSDPHDHPNALDPDREKDMASHCVTSWGVISLSGRDVIDLTQRIFTLDTARLSEGSGERAFLLDARGRVRHTFWFIRESAERCYVVCEADNASLLDSIDLYIFSEDVQLRQEPLSCVYRWGSPEQVTGPLEVSGYEAKLECYGAQHERVYLVAHEEKESVTSELSTAGSRALSPDQVESLRITWGAAGQPEYRQGVSPLDVSRSGISEGKGCYPGQEVIERTIALGRPAKYTQRVQLSGPSALLDSVSEGVRSGEEVMITSATDLTSTLGALTSVTAQGTLGVGLAQLKRSALGAPLALQMGGERLAISLTTGDE